MNHWANIRLAAIGLTEFIANLTMAVCLYVVGFALLVLAFVVVAACAWGLVCVVGSGVVASLTGVAVVAALAVVTTLAVISGWCGTRAFDKADQIGRPGRHSRPAPQKLSAKDSLLRGASRPTRTTRDELLRFASEHETPAQELLRSLTGPSR